MNTPTNLIINSNELVLPEIKNKSSPTSSMAKLNKIKKI